jgi:antitoxin component YwqK of YwqJK toxin-antitoxin module
LIVEKVIEFLYSGYLIPITFILLIVYFKVRNKINLSKSKFLTDFCVIAMFIFSIDIMIFPHRYALVEKSIMYFKNGESIVHYEDGSYQKINFVNGKLQGPAQFSLKDKFIEDFQYVDEIKSGKSIIHYKDGSYEARNYIDGILNGESELYFNNDIFMKRNYVNGKVQGSAQFYTKDGFKIEDFNYVDGVANGEATKYFSDGSYEKRNYVNSTLQGLTQKFSKDGIKIEEFKYVNGVRSNR